MQEPNVFPDPLGDIDLNTLTETDDIICPEKIEGSIFLDNLIRFKHLILPKFVGGGVFLGQLQHVEKLILPKRIGGNLAIYNLKTFKNVALPEYIGGSLFVYRLEDKIIRINQISGFIYINRAILVKTDDALYVNLCDGERHYIPFLTSKHELKTWIEETKHIYIPEKILIEILKNVYNRKQSSVLAKNILAGKMLISNVSS
jgi:hypothetical protein